MKSCVELSLESCIDIEVDALCSNRVVVTATGEWFFENLAVDAGSGGKVASPVGKVIWLELLRDIPPPGLTISIELLKV